MSTQDVTKGTPLFQYAEAHQYTQLNVIEYLLPIQLENCYSFLVVDMDVYQLAANYINSTYPTVEAALQAGHQYLSQHEVEVVQDLKAEEEYERMRDRLQLIIRS